MLSHAPGHWTTQLIYLGPIAIVVLYLGVQARRDKRRDEALQRARRRTRPRR